MEYILGEIEKALEGGLYVVALTSALCIPDICASLENQDGETNGKRYKDWFNKNLANNYKNQFGVFLSAEEMYRIRCSYLHQGKVKHGKSTYQKIMFSIPSDSNLVMHCNTIDGNLQLDIVQFCKDIVESARSWSAENRDSDVYKRNFTKLAGRSMLEPRLFSIDLPIIS